MKGWTTDGREVELTPHQEIVVEQILSWGSQSGPVTLPGFGRGAGKSTILATVAKIERERAQAVTLEDQLRDVMTFIADVAHAESLFRSLTKAEVVSLPIKAAAGMIELQKALAKLRHPAREVQVPDDN